MVIFWPIIYVKLELVFLKIRYNYLIMSEQIVCYMIKY